MRRRQKEPKETDSPAEARYVVYDIRVQDDGFPLTGRRLNGYLAEVTRRQAAGQPQDSVIIWHTQPVVSYTRGVPRITAEMHLEILEGETVLGVVKRDDDQLYFYPA